MLDLLSNKTRNLQVKNTLWTMQESGERDALMLVVHKFSSLNSFCLTCFWVSIAPRINGNLLRAQTARSISHKSQHCIFFRPCNMTDMVHLCNNFFLSVQHHHLMCTNILYILCIQLLILKKEEKDLRKYKGGGGRFFPSSHIADVLGCNSHRVMLLTHPDAQEPN